MPKIRHLYRCQRGFETLVSHLQAGAVDRLLERFASKHSESVGHPSLLRRLADAACDLVDDDIVVCRVAAQKASQADNGIVFLGFSQRASCRWNFERARRANDVNVFGFRAAAQQSIERASKQSLRDELIKPRDDDGETFASGAEIAFQGVDMD